MQTLTLYLPDSFSISPKEAAMLLATRLYEQGKLSLGQAAEMTGYSKRTFMELLGDYEVSIFQLTEEELKIDVQNAARYHC